MHLQKASGVDRQHPNSGAVPSLQVVQKSGNGKCAADARVSRALTDVNAGEKSCAHEGRSKIGAVDSSECQDAYFG